MSSGTVVLGLLNGLTIGLLAIGLVLIYKCNRFINLAHAQLGSLSALLLAKWTLDWHWNWWLAFLASVALGVGVGVGVDRFMIRPLRAKTRSPLALTLLSIGVSQLLLAFTFAPQLSPDPAKAALYPQPFESHARVGLVTLTGMSVLTLVLAPVLAIGLALFLRYASLGKQIRATANNPDAARLCGISVGKVSALSWGAAGGLSAISAVLQAPTQPSFNVASFGPYLLMLALGAAAFGAFLSLPAALGGGLVLGLVQQVVAAETHDAGKAELAVFGVMLAVILVRGQAIGRAFASSGRPLADQPVTRVPDVLAGTGLVRLHRRVLGMGALLLAGLVPLLPYFDSEGHRFLLALVVIYAVVGVALTMLVGWAGQVSLGHVGIVGLGAFMTAHLADHGWTLPAIMLASGLVGAAVLAAIGLPALRVGGLTLAVSTLGFAVIAPDWLFRQAWIGSPNPSGIPVDAPALSSAGGTPRSELAIYYLAVAVLVLCVLAAGALRRSAPGRIIIAVRDNEVASAAFGITPATVKLAILAVSGFFSAVAGVLWADAWGTVAPTHFDASVSIALLAVPVVGGLGSLSGAVAASVALYVPAFFLGPLVAPIFGDFGRSIAFQLFLSGAGLVVTLQKFPTGLAGVAQSRWQAFLNRRAITVEAVLAAAPDDLALNVNGVCVRFGGIHALDRAELTVRRGEIVGLIGPNGAGKSTLMNVISGVQRPSEGSVRIFGREVVDLPADFRLSYGLARSFQDAKLFPGLTVRETIQLAVAHDQKVGIVSAMLAAPWVRAGERETTARVEEILDRFGLRAHQNALTTELSTGTRRICDLAAQVATRPKLLLLDEPTAGIAQREAEAFGPLLRTIRSELDCAILIVEHDMPLLMSLCDRVYAMESGAVLVSGTPEEIRNDPRVIASYLGSEDVAISRSGTVSTRTATRAPARPRASATSSPRRATTKRSS